VAVVVLATTTYLVSFAAVFLYSRLDQSQSADAIVVLGAAQYNGRPSPVLKARLDHAITLYRAGYASVIVVTGGLAQGDRTTEATASKRYLVAATIPADSVVVESRGRTTAESMDAAAEYLHASGRAKVLLVSDPFHLARLHLEARRVHLTGFTSPTQTSPISTHFSTELGYLLAEALKLPLLLVRGIFA
jgi:uncharacterized SAM-binding protein YcdF (DUF218 family)